MPGSATRSETLILSLILIVAVFSIMVRVTPGDGETPESGVKKKAVGASFMKTAAVLPNGRPSQEKPRRFPAFFEFTQRDRTSRKPMWLAAEFGSLFPRVPTM